MEFSSGINDLDEFGPDYSQNISLNGRDHPHTIHGFEVNIHASVASSSGQVDSGSNKVKISTVTNQNWDLPTHHGKIVASNRKYLSYVLEGRNGYVLRLIQQETNSRVLLKGFVGAVVDVAFCHVDSNLLACIDQGGNLYIWDLDKTSEETKIQIDALKIVIHKSSTPDSDEHRLVWSPHVSSQEEEEEDQEICNIVVTHGNNVEVLDIRDIFSTYSSGMTVPRDKLCCGCFSISNAHESSIHDLSLSPDGSVLATASEDGHLKFWQVCWEKDDTKEPPKCLHDFVPHNGSPVTRLIFCDNHLSQDPGNQYWRFLMTASKSNTEIKIWCTVNWKCLQTIRFFSSENNVESHILLNVDLSASYLIATDSNRMAILVLQLFHSSGLGDASVTSVTEYLLTQPILSFIISGCVALSSQFGQDENSGDDSAEDDTVGELKKDVSLFDSRRNIVMIKLHCVHTKSMQELLVKFEPPDIYGVPPSKEALLVMASEVSHYDDTLTGDPVPSFDISSDAPIHLQPTSLPADLNENLSNSQSAVKFHSLASLTDSPKLLTPSEFTLPAKVEDTHDSAVPLCPLLSPASIRDAANSNETSQVNDLMKNEDLGHVPIGNQPINSSHSRSDVHSSLTAVTSECDNPSKNDELAEGLLTGLESNATVPETVSPESSDVVDSSARDQLRQKSAEVEDDLDITVQVHTSSSNSARTVPIHESTSEEDEPSVQATQKAFDNIFKLLDVEKPQSPSLGMPSESNQHSFDEFTELLRDPVKLQEQEEALRVAGEIVSLHNETPQSGDEHSQIVNAAATKSSASFLNVLRAKSSSQNENEMEDMEDDHNGGASDSRIEGSNESQQPDSGTSEVPLTKESSQSTIYDLDEASAVKGVVSSELYQKDNQLPGLRLTMPSALGSPLDSQLQPNDQLGLGVPGIPPDDLNQNNPALPMAYPLQDALTQSKPAFESVEGVLKTKSRSRRRSRKGKKQISSGLTSADVPVEMLEAPSQSDGEVLPGEPVESSSTKVQSTPKDAADLNLLSHLVQIVSDQQQLLQDMRREQESNYAALQEKLLDLKVSIAKEQRAALAELKIDQQQKIDRILKDKQVLDKQRQDKLITSLSHTLTTAVHAKVDKLIKTEVKSTIIPVIQKSVSSLHEEVSGTLSRHLNTTDTSIKEAIDQLLRSKDMPGAIGDAMVTSLQRTLPAVYEDTLRNVVLSLFERSCQEMFQQVDEAFRRGTVEYLSQLQQHQYSLHEPTLKHLLSCVQSLQSIMSNPQDSPFSTNLHTVIHQEISSFSQKMHETLMEAVSGAVQKEVGKIIELHNTSKTPQVSLLIEDKKDRVQKLIQSESYNSAFELALSTSDLQLVTYLCQQVNPDVIFDKTPCPLSQPVLLSLIQQLSVNLQDNLELKMKYLDQSVLVLDVNDDVTKSHMVPVIRQLSHQIISMQGKLQSDSSLATPAIIKQVKRLLMVAQHMCQ